jgi:hypothetical protein
LLGYSLGSAWICLADSFDFLNEKSWLGRVQFRLHGASDRDRRMIGVAGEVATIHWSEGDPEDCILQDTFLSESDWGMTGCPPGKPDQKFFEAAIEVSALLDPSGQHWSNVTRTARRLIYESRWQHPLQQKVAFADIFVSDQRARCADKEMAFSSSVQI